MYILTQFIYRISFGLALAMAITSPREVTSGYFRNHSYVLLGLNALATMVAWSNPASFPLWPALVVSGLSYAAAVAWLYEKKHAGIVLLFAVSAVSILGGWLSLARGADHSFLAQALALLDPLTSGLVMGVTIAAMFLGHWYLNAPGMALAPLNKLVRFMAAAIVLRMIVSAVGVITALQTLGPSGGEQTLFLILRWLSGLIGALAVAWMTLATLKIPNTQAATGLLYVGVISTFLGELVALLLSLGSSYPL